MHNQAYKTAEKEWVSMSGSYHLQHKCLLLLFRVMTCHRACLPKHSLELCLPSWLFEALGLTGISPRAGPWAPFKAPGGAESIEGKQPGSNLATLPPAPAQHSETAARKATGCGSGSWGPSWLGAARGDVEVAAKQEGSSQMPHPSASAPFPVTNISSNLLLHLFKQRTISRMGNGQLTAS